ncbi:MAG TPA: membrane protein insertase YidC [Allosphingosinicella sp.]|nr:membrane protein insertase YidC [Allosphingosinicella sp.]
MNDNKNMILAIVLSALVLLGWGFLSESFFPVANPPATKIEKGRQVPVARPEADPAADGPRALRDRRIVLAETPRVAIRTPRLAGSINLKGARIDDLVLTTEREGIGANSPPIRLFSPAGAPGAYYGEFGWLGQGVAAPGPDTIWQASGPALTPSTPVTLSWNNGRGQIFQIVLSVDQAYLFTAEQRLINRGAGAVAARPFALVSRVGPSRDPDSWTVHVGPMGVFNGAADYGNDYSSVAEAGQVPFNTRGGWLGFTDQYWLAAVIPGQSGNVDAALRYMRPTNSYQADYLAAPAIVAPGRASRYTSHLFAGAKEIELLESYTEALGTQLERAIDWGWFRWFMFPIFSLLNWLFAQIGNFGAAIICLVVIVRALLFPIAQKQFASFAKMRVIQPKMKALQERFADDKPRLQQETMKLYKEEKVNPVAGCLPILLQIPIFYALYKVLLISVEMRHEPFALWIRDLSAPDPLTPVNLFGYLPFTPPSILAVGVLPILVGVTMWLQMRLNPQMPDPIQRQIFALMPWVLMFVMAPFAAGLQLYWVTNNILTIAQQKWLYMRNPAMKPAPEPAPSPSPAPSPPPAAPKPRRAKRPRSR